MKRQQNAERLDFLQAQKETLNKVIEEQRAEVYTVSNPSISDLEKMNENRKAHSDERKEIIKTQGEERTKEAEIWAAERKAYRN